MKKLYLLCIISFCIFSYLFIYNYISQENIYDNFRFYKYHQEYINAIETIYNQKLHSIIHFINLVKNSIISYFSIIIVSIIGILFKYSRLEFILVLTYAYLLPSIILTFLLYKDILDKYKNKSIYLELVLIIILCLNIYYWLPTLRGMPDVSALIPYIIAIYIIHKNNLREKIVLKQSILIGILIFLSFLCRRTFSTAVFILLLTTFLYNTILIIKDIFNKKITDKKQILLQFLNTIINLLIPSIIFIVLFKNCLPALFNYFISGDLVEECNYYLSDKNIIERIIAIIKYITPITLILIVLPLLIKTKYTNNNKKFLLFSYLFIFLYFTLFLFIQDILFENILPISLFINIIILYSISLIYNALKNNYVKKGICILLVIFYTLNFYIFFFKKTYKYQNMGKYLFSEYSESGTPIKNSNDKIFKQLYNFLGKKLKEHPDYTISSITSERLFDPETLIYYSLINNNKEMIRNIINIPAITPNGLIFEAYESNYLIVAKNWGKHVSQKSWLPISIIHDDFKNNEGISKYYTKIIELKTNSDESGYIYVYEKNKEIPIFEMENIMNKFIKEVPDKKDMVLKQFNDYKNYKEFKKLQESGIFKQFDELREFEKF